MKGVPYICLYGVRLEAAKSGSYNDEDFVAIAEADDKRAACHCLSNYANGNESSIHGHYRPDVFKYANCHGHYTRRRAMRRNVNGSYYDVRNVPCLPYRGPVIDVCPLYEWPIIHFCYGRYGL